MINDETYKHSITFMKINSSITLSPLWIINNMSILNNSNKYRIRTTYSLLSTKIYRYHKLLVHITRSYTQNGPGPGSHHDNNRNSLFSLWKCVKNSIQYYYKGFQEPSNTERKRERERKKERGKSCTKDTQQNKQHIGIQLAEFLEINLRRRNQVAVPTKCHFLKDSRNSWILKIKPYSVQRVYMTGITLFV